MDAKVSGWRVRVQRDLKTHRWVVHSLTHGLRVGTCEGLLLKDVTFELLDDTGWAVGTLVSWNDMQLASPRTAGMPPAGENLPDGLFFNDLKFEKSPKARFYTQFQFDVRIAKWLMLLGSLSQVA